MNKDFWASIAKNDYKIPEGHSLEELTRTLFGYLSSTDPELRDEIAYTLYANWLKQGVYTKEQAREHAEELLENLEIGIGETESNSVFIRAFSVLFLAEIVHNDNKKPLLEKDQIARILAKGLWYLAAEEDPRGYVPVKGWAHALAHTADLMLVLARNRYITGNGLQNILNAISTKMIHSTHYLYIHGDDERLASAVVEVLRRGLLSPDQVQTWIGSFLAPDSGHWKGAYLEEARNRAFQNTRNLLRSIYLALELDEGDISDRGTFREIFLKTLRELRPY
ncbi:MAG TPA: DUF2785 domain-containing protein [Anaerolineales bacterium]|nr:DUF2785 domain-containing protein [Anaerolineales bacterium]